MHAPELMEDQQSCVSTVAGTEKREFICDTNPKIHLRAQQQAEEMVWLALYDEDTQT
jgi:hypothetical protein